MESSKKNDQTKVTKPTVKAKPMVKAKVKPASKTKVMLKKRTNKTNKLTDSFIRTYDELMIELNNTPDINKEVRIVPNKKMSAAEATHLMAILPKLRKKAFLKNNLNSLLFISDLSTALDGVGACLRLMPESVFNLGNIPARNILNSIELRHCFDAKQVELVDEDVFIASFKKLESECFDNLRNEATLPVFSSFQDLNEHEYVYEPSSYDEMEVMEIAKDKIVAERKNNPECLVDDFAPDQHGLWNQEINYEQLEKDLEMAKACAVERNLMKTSINREVMIKNSRENPILALLGVLSWPFWRLSSAGRKYYRQNNSNNSKKN